MKSLIGTDKVVQIGIIVNDIIDAKRKYAEFLGVDIPEHFDGGNYNVTQTVFKNMPAPKANCLMAFFDVGDSLQIELIEPNGVPSAWQDFLDNYGEGLHHIAFNIENMDEQIQRCKKFGMELIQRGKYGSGDGEYAYLDARATLRCYIELLENY